MSNRNFKAWATLAVAAALFAMTGQRCIPRPTRGPQVTVTATPTSGTNSVDVTLAATVTGGTEPYTYAWTASPAATITGADTANATATVTATTTFTCTVTDADSDTDSADATVTVTSAVIVTISGATTANGGEAVPLTALVTNQSGAVAFSWLQTAVGTAGSATLSNATSQTATATFSNDAEGTFTFQVTATDSAGSDSDTISIVATPTGSPVATTFTVGTDDLTGTTGADIFDASLYYNQYTDTWIQTLTSADQADGLDGDDVLNAELTAAVTPTLSNIETFNVTNTVAVTFDMVNVTGTTAVNMVNSTGGALTLDNVPEIPALGMDTTAQNLVVNAWDADVSGATDEMDASFDGATGTLTVAAGIEILNVTATGAASTVADINMNGTMTDMTIAGAGDLAVTANLNTNNATLDTIDASTATGDLELLVGAAALDMTITGGAGDDTIAFSAAYTADDDVDGGAGTDTLSLVSADADVTEAQSNVAGFEALTISDAMAGNITATYFGAIATVNLPEGIDAGVTLTVASGTTVNANELSTSTGAAVITVSGSGTSDSVAFAFAGANAMASTTDFAKIETVNVSTADAAGTFTGAVAVNTAGATRVLNITGDNDCTFGAAVTANTIDASALTGNLIMSAATVAPLGVVLLAGGSGDDVLYGSTLVDNITTGDGDNEVHAAAGDDNIACGAGEDTIVYVSGTDGTETISNFTAGTDGDIFDTNFATSVAFGADTNADVTPAAGAVTLDTAADAVFEVVGTLRQTISDYTTVSCADLMLAISDTSVSVDTSGDTCLLIVYDGGDAYLFEITEGADGDTNVGNDGTATLVAVFDTIASGAFVEANIE